jgi:hypothetical protein
LSIFGEGDEFSKRIDSTRLTHSAERRPQRSPIRIDIKIMTRGRVHHAQQNLDDNATAKRAETFATTKFSHSKKFRFTQQVIPKRGFLVQAARAEKIVVIIVETNFFLVER